MALYFTVAMALLTPIYGKVLRGKLGNEFFFLASWYSGPALMIYAMGGVAGAVCMPVHAVLLWIVLKWKSRAWQGYPLLLYIVPIFLLQG